MNKQLSKNVMDHYLSKYVQSFFEIIIIGLYRSLD